ncbi:response regulator [Nostoc sp. FACHB-87]|uniref:response regulator n=1 Tax=Nostocales TaxID=1161 RepID=UPI001684A93D|nr:MULTISPECIES: response regulator [Nostocales]MBD2458222.1 response regulator [Nostoc sp. FACHB-87]MBD2480076.1 response regulator [Anabaena sp. FACHB-83]MBD2491597.1 response regulator [Aulosira sp. FACHB-615]
MKGRQPTVTILMADDDEDDSMLVREAITVSQLPIDLHTVSNGEELMDYLHRRGQYTDNKLAPRPGLILLDLNMPKKNGLEVLKEIKTDPELRTIPVIVLTTSKAEENIHHTYSLGANSYIVKPMTFSALVELMETFGKYWFEIVELPLAVVGGENEEKPNQSSTH